MGSNATPCLHAYCDATLSCSLAISYPESSGCLVIVPLTKKPEDSGYEMGSLVAVVTRMDTLKSGLDQRF